MTRSIAALMAAGICCPPSLAHAQVPAPDVLQTHRADLPRKVRSLSPARLDRADVAQDVPGEPSVGTRDQGAREARRCRRGTSTRRSAFRSSRTIARSPTIRLPPLRSGSMAALRGRSQGHAEGEGVARRPDVDLRGDVRSEGAGPDHPVDVVDAEERPQRYVVEAGGRHWSHRTALGARDRSAARHGEGRKITHHANSISFRTNPVRSRRRDRADSWSGRSARKARSCARTAAS